MSDYREAWEAAIKVCRERNDEVASLRAQLAIAGEHIAEMTDQLASANEMHGHAARRADALVIKLESARKALEQVAIVATQHMDRDCNHRMALDAVRQVANDYLSLTDEEGKS